MSRELTVPEALLLDFGGVVSGSSKRPDWTRRLAEEVHRQLVGAGFHGLTPEQITIDIEAGSAADRAWKAAMSRPFAPEEMTHLRYWTELIAGDWPEQARALVTAHATELCRMQGELRMERSPREGIEELLRDAASAGIRCGIVSNALSGAVHRAFMERTGLDKRVALQLYSDEVGIRKPNPEMILMAARALGTAPSACWYVGDTFDRDVVCGRRAAVGAVILMEAPGTYRRPYPVRDLPDAVVSGPPALRRLLDRVLVERSNPLADLDPDGLAAPEGVST
jgi:HAD superfamily hydrolase (TIGR01549 family)